MNGLASLMVTVRDRPTLRSRTTPLSSSRLTSLITVVWSTPMARARSDSVRGARVSKKSSISSSRCVSVRKIGRRSRELFCTYRSISCVSRRSRFAYWLLRALSSMRPSQPEANDAPGEYPMGPSIYDRKPGTPNPATYASREAEHGCRQYRAAHGFHVGAIDLRSPSCGRRHIRVGLLGCDVELFGVAAVHHEGDGVVARDVRVGAQPGNHDAHVEPRDGRRAEE